MPYDEDDWLPISALQHYMFCNRRAALVHTEGLWAENRFTTEGTLLHRRADDPKQNEKRCEKRTMRGVGLCSPQHGLTGRADVVEFITDAAGVVTVNIVEYKRGEPKPRLDAPYRIQLCAQALCVEDMLGCDVPRGYLFFAKVKRRIEVTLDQAIRDQTISIINQVHALIASGLTPPPIYKPRKCKACSLINLCLPTAPRARKTASRYLDSLVRGGDE